MQLSRRSSAPQYYKFYWLVLEFERKQVLHAARQKRRSFHAGIRHHLDMQYDFRVIWDSSLGFFKEKNNRARWRSKCQSKSSYPHRRVSRAYGCTATDDRRSVGISGSRLEEPGLSQLHFLWFSQSWLSNVLLSLLVAFLRTWLFVRFPP